MRYFTICEEKNPGYRIIKLICHCFLTNLRIHSLLNHINHYHIKKGIVDTIQRFCSNLSVSKEPKLFELVTDTSWDETVTLTKHVTKYKYMRKWIFEFLSKSQSRVLKIARVTSIRMTKSINLFNFLWAIPRDDVIESTRFMMRPPVIIPP